jgi:hypothetical protein
MGCRVRRFLVAAIIRGSAQEDVGQAKAVADHAARNAFPGNGIPSGKKILAAVS